MERSGFFDANLVGGTYDRKYVSQDFADYFATFIGNGVFGDQLDELMVAASDPNAMSITLKPGRAFIDGRWYENDKDMVLTIGTANGTYARIDNVVIHWSKNDRTIRAEIVEGVPGSSPSAPELRRSDDEWDLKLAEVKVGAGALTINQGNITDTRDNAEACGFVKGLVDQIDASNYINIAVSNLNNEFTAWFDGIKGQLSGDVAGNLQNQINSLSSELSGVINKIPSADGETIQDVEGILSVKDLGIKGKHVADGTLPLSKLNVTLDELSNELGIINEKTDIVKFMSGRKQVFSAQKRTGSYDYNGASYTYDLTLPGARYVTNINRLNFECYAAFDEVNKKAAMPRIKNDMSNSTCVAYVDFVDSNGAVTTKSSQALPLSQTQQCASAYNQFYDNGTFVSIRALFLGTYVYSSILKVTPQGAVTFSLNTATMAVTSADIVDGKVFGSFSDGDGGSSAICNLNGKLHRLIISKSGAMTKTKVSNFTQVNDLKYPDTDERMYFAAYDSSYKLVSINKIGELSMKTATQYTCSDSSTDLFKISDNEWVRCYVHSGGTGPSYYYKMKVLETGLLDSSLFDKDFFASTLLQTQIGNIPSAVGLEINGKKYLVPSEASSDAVSFLDIERNIHCKVNGFATESFYAERNERGHARKLFISGNDAYGVEIGFTYGSSPGYWANLTVKKTSYEGS